MGFSRLGTAGSSRVLASATGAPPHIQQTNAAADPPAVSKPIIDNRRAPGPSLRFMASNSSRSSPPSRRNRIFFGVPVVPDDTTMLVRSSGAEGRSGGTGASGDGARHQPPSTTTALAGRGAVSGSQRTRSGRNCSARSCKVEGGLDAMVTPSL